MKATQLITTLCLLSIFLTHPQSNSEEIERLTEKIIQEEIKANFCKPGIVSKITMYGALFIGALFYIDEFNPSKKDKLRTDCEIKECIQVINNSISIFLLAKIFRSYSEFWQEEHLIKKRVYEKQLELITSKRAL